MAVTYPRGFSAGDAGATLRTWGLQDGDSCHQLIGAIPITTGLALVFPNIYQHSQTAFQLADASKDGHMTVLQFLLVDCDIHPVISTGVVAPQQKEWIRRAVDDSVDMRLPVEVIDRIMEEVEGLMTDDDANDIRRELLQERANFWKANNNYHFCIPFDIWNGPDMAH